MKRPKCNKCGRTMLPSEDGVSYYCPKCHTYKSRDETDVDQYKEKQHGA